ncbi:MAG: VIT1/CCC1 transporter family protein [Candidatus Dormibacteria bacterium]
MTLRTPPSSGSQPRNQATPPTVPPTSPAADERRKLLSQLGRNWSDEVSSARLYRRLAALQPEGEARQLLEEMSEQELRHAAHWRTRLEELGGSAPRDRTGLRELVLPLVARLAGLSSVISLIEGGEARGKLEYLRQTRELPDARSRAIATEILPEERSHQGTAARLRLEGGTATAHSGLSLRAHVGDIIRDLIFGLNDGLLSNFSLIAGVSGAGTSRAVVLLAGVAGLLAGAVSMAAGSYLSNKSQREVVAEEINRKGAELDYDPDGERDELRSIYRRKGFTEEEIEILVRRITADRERWLDVLVTEDLGFGREPGPPPVLDALFTGGGFAVGALVPLVPYLFAGGMASLIVAGCLSILALFAVGAAKSIFTARSAVRSGMEMVIIGVFAGIVTNVVGRLFGQAVA